MTAVHCGAFAAGVVFLVGGLAWCFVVSVVDLLLGLVLCTAYSTLSVAQVVVGCSCWLRLVLQLLAAMVMLIAFTHGCACYAMVFHSWLVL